MPDFDLYLMDWKENAAFFLLFLMVGIAIGHTLAFIASKLGLRSAQFSSSVGHFGIGCVGTLFLSGVAGAAIFKIFNPEPDECSFTPDTLIFVYFMPFLAIAAIATYMRRASGINK